MDNTDKLELFKSEFEKWQKKFGLTGYKCYFKCEKLQGHFADITISQDDMVVTARLNSRLSEKDKQFEDIKRSAKHEAIHLLVGRLEQNARYRYTTSEEIYESTEELVFKLENLIK